MIKTWGCLTGNVWKVSFLNLPSSPGMDCPFLLSSTTIKYTLTIDGGFLYLNIYTYLRGLFCFAFWHFKHSSVLNTLMLTLIYHQSFFKDSSIHFKSVNWKLQKHFLKYKQNVNKVNEVLEWRENGRCKANTFVFLNNTCL